MSELLYDVDQRIRHRSPRWLADGLVALDIPEATVSDYSLTSLGNLKRVDGVIDWAQDRAVGAEQKLARAVGRDRLPGSHVVNGAVDTTQGLFWEVYRFAQRIAIQIVDDTLLSGIEDRTDRAINTWRKQPAEVIATAPDRNESTTH